MDPEFQKVVQAFLRTPPQPHKKRPKKGAAKGVRKSKAKQR
jgi:hypothetical protein